MIQEIKHHNQLLAIIISNNYSETGIHFFMLDDFSQQMAFMKHLQGKIIQPHAHNSVPREIHYTKKTNMIYFRSLFDSNFLSSNV